MVDIYFDENYGKLYEEIEKGQARWYLYDGKEGVVRHQFIVREIPICLEDGPWYDIITPYGYGGPLIEKICEGYDKGDLIEAFEKAFSKYCEREKIVSEFVRFYPLFNNAIDFQKIYNSELNRYTLATNLTLDDPVNEEFSKSCRKNIRKAISSGVSWRVFKAPSNIDDFKAIYYSTMDRNKASDFYYFNDDYFKKCEQYFQERLLVVQAIFDEKIIAMGLYFLDDFTIHIHLSGTLTQYLYLSPAYILRYAVVLWGRENGFELIHHGGGRSGDANDSLYCFKKQFAQKTEFPFYVGKKIWNKEKYSKLCHIRNVGEDETFFPAYRKI